METIQLLDNGEQQVVVRPESCRLSGEEILVNKLGDAVLLVPKEKAWETLINGLNYVPDDFLPNGKGPRDSIAMDVT